MSRAGALNRKVFDNQYSFFVLLALFVGVFVRSYNITNLPHGLNQDEASIGYETFSLLNSGSDRNGNSFPVHFVSWGNGQNALYAYFSMPFVSVFGLNVFSVRIVNTLFSSLSLFVFFLLFRLVFDKKKALVALIMLAICPWNIMLARWGLESNIFPFIFLLGVFFLLKGITSSSNFFPLSFSVFAISLYSYGTSYLILPLFFLFVIPYLFYKRNITVRHLILSLTVFAIISLPLILFVIINQFSLSQIEILGITIPKLVENRTTQIFNVITPNFTAVLVKNIVRFVSVFVLQSDGNYYNAIPSFGTIYIISFPFFIVGLLTRLKKEILKSEPHHYIFFVWLICSFILGFSSQVNVNRINIIFFPTLYFVILGLFDVYNFLIVSYRYFYKLFLVAVYSLFFALFLGSYFIYSNEKGKQDFASGLGDAIRYAETIEPKETINITENGINMPYIYVCFYNQIDPAVFRSTVTYGKSENGFRSVTSFGHYTFGNDKHANIRILNENEMEYNMQNLINSKRFGNYYVATYK